MARVYRSKYGIPGNEVKNLTNRYYGFLESGWVSADDFVIWAIENGYKKGAHLLKKNDSEAHGPNNSVFCDSKEQKRKILEKRQEYLSIQSPFCEKCERISCPGRSESGCVAWRAYFVKNWNENIHFEQEAKNEIDPRVQQYFQYEHPDLVREGIVFEHS